VLGRTAGEIDARADSLPGKWLVSGNFARSPGAMKYPNLGVTKSLWQCWWRFANSTERTTLTSRRSG